MAFCLKMKSDYSFLSSTIKVIDAISFCKQTANNYLSLIDTNLHGSMEFYSLCIKNNIRPIIGLEVSVNYNGIISPFTLIAKSEIGYKNLVKLSSLSYNQVIEYKVLAMYAQDIALVLSSKDSILSTYISDNNLFDANELIESLKEIYKEVYIGIYRYKGSSPLLLNDIKEYASQANIKCIACQEATHKDVKDTIALNMLDCIKKSIPANKDFLNDNSIIEAYLKNDEQLKIYYDQDEIDNLMSLARSINLKINKIDYSLPKVYENEDENEKLSELAKQALIDKGLHEDLRYVNRVNYELSIIIKMGFANYYLIVADYVKYAKYNNILVGPSRGSGGASLIAYLLNITTIDPIKYDLLFERFLNPSRSNYPDFDIDFADIKRDEVIEYVKYKYGNKHVAYISTFATFGAKSAIRDIARIMKVSNEDIDYLLKNCSNNMESISKEYKENKKFKDLLDIHSNYKAICSLASQIEGLKKQVGLHAAGIILSKDNLDEIVPCFTHSTNSLAIQYDYVTAEKLGLIKMDFLGLKNLTIIEYCLNKINEKYDCKYTIDNFPFDEKSAYTLISGGDCIGLFQLESEGMINVIKKLKPSCFDDIVALIALYRPGPMDMINKYIERKNDPDYFVKDEKLKDILSSTYGIIIYQEQIMQICQRVASYSLADADILRRAISKKDLNVIKNEKEKFVNGCINNAYSIQEANQLFAIIERFASYGFNKAHSVGYAKITVMMAYIKAHYTDIFYEALLNVNNENGEKRKQLFYEAKKHNIKIIKPSVLTSNKTFSAINNEIIYGLNNISTIKDNISSIIINERKIEPFNDLNDFIIRMVLNDVSMQVLMDLTYAGALDCFNVSRSKIIANMNSLYTNALMYKGLDYKPNSYKEEKFSFITTPILFKDDIETDYYKKEFEMLNFYLSIHPIEKLKQEYKNVINIYDINYDGNYDILGKITLIEKRKTKDNNTFLSINVEDESKAINIREYNNVEKYEYLKKGDIILANITIKNRYAYLNNASIKEVK